MVSFSYLHHNVIQFEYEAVSGINFKNAQNYPTYMLDYDYSTANEKVYLKKNGLLVAYWRRSALHV